MSPLSSVMVQMGKADEFKYPLITGVLAGLQRAMAPAYVLAIGGGLWLLFAITTKIGDVGEWPADMKEWLFVLAPILFNSFVIYAAVVWGVQVPNGNGGTPDP